MTDKLPPLPELGPGWAPYWTKKVHEQMQAYACAALAQAQSLPAVKATDQRMTFDTWLRSVCLQAPPDHAKDLARSAWIEADKQASADCEAMAEEIERLQKALAFWMPYVPSTDHPLYLRVVHDAYLLVGYDGPNNEPSAFELGHVVLAESQPTLWAIHVPGPDDYYPAPSEEAASNMASKHNAAMAEWNKANPDTSGNRPPIESSMASAQRWPGSAEDHAEEIAVFDYAAWGLASPQPVAQPGDCEWTNCPNRVGDVCCNEKVKPEQSAKIAELERQLAEVQAELAAIRALEPVAWINQAGDYVELSSASTVYGSHTIPLVALPEQKK